MLFFTIVHHLTNATEENSDDASHIRCFRSQKGGITDDEKERRFKQRIITNRGELGAESANKAENDADDEGTREDAWMRGM